MKFKKGKCEVLHLGSPKALHQYRLVAHKLTGSSVVGNPGVQQHHGPYLEEYWQQAEGGDPEPSSSWALPSARSWWGTSELLGSPVQERRALDGVVLAKSCKCVEGAGASEERLREPRWPCLEKRRPREFCGHVYEHLLRGGEQGGATPISVVSSKRTSHWSQTEGQEICSNFKKNISIRAKQRRRLPRQFVASPSVKAA